MKTFLLVCASLLVSVFFVIELYSGPDLVTLHHRGVGLLYQHRFSEAERIFARLATREPDDATPWLNLGIARLNQDTKESLAGAMEALHRAATLDPADPRPHYCLGIIHKDQGDLPVALESFERALELARETSRRSAISDCEYLVGSCLKQLGDRDRALSHFEAAKELNPRNLSVWHNLQQEWRRRGRTEEADEAAEQFGRLRESKRGRTMDTVFTEMGELAEPVPDWIRATKEVSDRRTKVRFAAPEALTAAPGPYALVDHDLDCVPDLWCGGQAVGVWSLREGFGKPQGSLFPLAEAVSFAVADFTEDGLVDLVVGTRDGVIAFAREGEELTFAPGRRIEGTAGPYVRLLDLDLESDLDLLAHGGGVSPAIAINQGREFARFDDPPTMGNVPADARLLLARDLDDDGDVEFLFAKDGVILVDNDPQWRFTAHPPGRRVAIPGPVTHIAAGDLDRDGDDDLVVAGTAAGIYLNDGNGNFESPPQLGELFRGAQCARILDIDLDGFLDLIVGRRDSSTLLLNRALKLGELEFVPTDHLLPGLTSLTSADVDDDLDPDLVGRGPEGTLWFIRNDTDPVNRAVRLYLGGQRDAEDRRTNHLGIGARVEVCSENLIARATNEGALADQAQGVAPLIVGIGPRDAVDALIIRWPDRVIQSELDVPLDSCERIDEVQRKMSSCPILFTWDGRRYRFITDFLGGGGLGFWLGIDEYGDPDPTETVRIPPDALVPIDGELRLSVMEPMEEVTYLDRLALRVIDHPERVDVYPDELFATGTVAATGQALAISRAHRIFPSEARGPGQPGADVRAALLEVDRQYASCQVVDPDLLGYTRSHRLTFTFGDELPRAGDVRLFLTGWVEYPYSRLNFAAHQAGRRLEPPTFSWRRSADEKWQLLHHEVGYPAGMPKTMVLDISSVVAEGAREFRIETNMEIYWDQIFAATVLPDATLRERVATLTKALLRFGGYPREYSDDGSLPRTYHYHERQAHIPYKKMRGQITRQGDVRSLLARVDDRFVIVGGGDELLLTFSADGLGDLPRGWTRTYLLDTHGYCKDMDPLTATAASVEPLPFGAMTRYPPLATEKPPERERYRRDWNTRQD